MKSWKEAAEELLAQQKAAEIARGISSSASTERLIGIGKTRIAELDSSLNIGQKLRDINRDVLRGIGEVEVEDAVVTSSKAYRGIWLHLSTGGQGSIEEKTEVVEEHLYGKHTVDREFMGGENDIRHWTEEVVGPYDKWVGRRLTGFTRHGNDNASIGAYYGIYPDTETIIVGIADSLSRLSDTDKLAGLSPKQLEILGEKAGWDVKVVLEKDRFASPPHDPWDSSIYFLGDSKLPRWHGSYVEIRLPHRKDNLEFIVSLIDSVLLLSSAGRLPHIAEWVQNKAESEAKIRDIQRRVGQVYPLK